MNRALLLAGAVAALCACGTTKESRRFTRDEATALIKRLEVVSLELGEYPIDGAASVVDGDTIRVKGLSATLRLLGIDTEETFKHSYEREAFAGGWEQYKKKMRGASPRPVKMATPLGEDAKTWAEGFFQDVKEVRLERDHPGEIRDFYGRYLAYIFVKRGTEWVNYNVECVRAGMSPYFVKYGRSRRFHKQFLDAQVEARAAQRGIWRPGAFAYDDYDERLAWWGEREKAITRFEREMQDHPDSYIALTRWDALLKLEQKVGSAVTVLGSVQEIRLGDRGPSVVKLARSRSSSFDVVFFDRDVLNTTGIQFKKGEFVTVRGVVQKYKDPRGMERLQVLVSLPGQVLAPSTDLEELLNPEPKAPRPGTPEEEGD